MPVIKTKKRDAVATPIDCLFGELQKRKIRHFLIIEIKSHYFPLH
jgi:hypothetical protein